MRFICSKERFFFRKEYIHIYSNVEFINNEMFLFVEKPLVLYFVLIFA